MQIHITWKNDQNQFFKEYLNKFLKKHRTFAKCEDDMTK